MRRSIRMFLVSANVLLAWNLWASETLTLRTPLDRQVIQRGPQDTADLVVSGQVTGKPDAIEVKAELAANAAHGEATDWVVVAKGGALSADGFSGKIRLTAGGWYAISIREMNGKNVLAEQRIEHLGVGDVFITAGQSNSANFGSKRMAAKDDRVVYFDGKTFVPAQDPIPGGFGGGGSPWAIAGDLIAKATGMPVCFRSTTLDYSPVKEWLKDATKRKRNYYETLLERTQYFGVNGVRAVLWHQGESDSLDKTSAEDYCKQLAAVAEALSKDVGYKLDWFVAGASFHPGCGKPQWDAVAEGQKLLWSRKLAFKGAFTDDLIGPEFRAGDKVHFNEKGLQEHGRRWFEALAAQYGWKAGK